jgi:hypothetical protein
MLLTVLPRGPGVSWRSHLGGAVGGALAEWLFRRLDPIAPRKRYSWEIEDELAAEAERAERDQFELPSPGDVPVLWERPERDDDERGKVLEFPRRDR